MMKKLAFAAVLFLLFFRAGAQAHHAPAFNPRLHLLQPTAFASSFYFRPHFIHPASLYATFGSMFPDHRAVYTGFHNMQYRFPEAAVFCRMENASCKRYGFMFSIHAGGYSER